jgi:hypothetical protein
MNDKATARAIFGKHAATLIELIEVSARPGSKVSFDLHDFQIDCLHETSGDRSYVVSVTSVDGLSGRSYRKTVAEAVGAAFDAFISNHF